MHSRMTSNLRIYPGDQMSLPGASAAVSTSNYGAATRPRVTLKEPQGRGRSEGSSSLEQAYWSGMRKKAGLPRLESDSKTEDEDRKYEQFRKSMSQYVESNFHQRECKKFVPKPNQNVKMNKDLKCHCGEILYLHSWGSNVLEPGNSRYIHEDFIDLMRKPTEKPPEVMPTATWTADYIQDEKSWTYGKMSFNVETSAGKKPAKFLRLSDQDSVDTCLEFMENFWHIMEPNEPNLVISVVGGAKNFRLDGEMRDTFATGLIKAAKTTNAWLITSGFNMGVMKSVGQAVKEGQAFQWDNDRMTHLLRAIAIAPWGYVYQRRFLQGRNRRGKFNAYYRASNMILHGQPVSLNPDHTHFIFVDDGFRNRYGGVADFRARFERKLCTPKGESGYGIPVVMVVVEGGPDAIQDACQSLKEGIPVVVCTGTGRAADLLTYAHKFTYKDRSGERIMNERQRKTLEDKVASAYSKNWGKKGEEELEKIMNKIDECMERDNLMVFFDLRREEDLDVAILSVLTKAETSSGAKDRLNQLKLALTWNRADIAQSEIFREDINWDPNELYPVMTTALQEDKMSFVRLLLNQGISMREYLTVPRLEELYKSIPKHGYLRMVLKRHLNKDKDFTVADLGRFLKKMLDRFHNDQLDKDSKEFISSHRGSKKGGRGAETTDTEADEEPGQFQRPYKHLLIWAVLMNRAELAKFFWEMGEEPITSALAASLLCSKMHKYIPKYLHTLRQDFVDMKKMFEELATIVLDECHSVDPEKAIMLVERKSPSWSRMTCQQIAAASSSKVFMASAACYNSVNNVWQNGILSDWRKVFLCTLMPFLIFSLIKVTDMGDKQLNQWQKFQTFITAPITKFVLYMFSYMAFLMVYTYMLLVDFNQYPSPLEIFLMIWILSFFLCEVHTFVVFPSPTFYGKMRDWFTFLNRLEMVNLFMASIAFALRSNSDYYVEAKTIYCINAVIFFIRIIKVYIANSHLGPKLNMIFQMVEELTLFMMVLVVFLLAYGVASQGLLYKRREPSFDIVKDIIQFPYWQLYGEIFLDEIQTDTECVSRLSNGTTLAPYDNTCRESYWLVYIMLGLYLLVGNVLLLNLLIAIFSHVFNMVQENSVEIWKYQMYFLVMEFQVNVALPPPLSIFQHIFLLAQFLARRYCCKKVRRNGEGHTGEQFQQHHLMYLALFEKEMMANYLRKLKEKSMDSMQRRFTKLQKRVDMLNKIIEDRHVEDELAQQSSLRLSDGLRIMRAVNSQQSLGAGSASLPSIAESASKGPLAQLLAPDKVAAAIGEQQRRRIEPGGGGDADRLVPAYKSQAEKDAKYSHSLGEVPEEEEKHKKKKKKKKKHKSKDRDSSPKLLNINVPEADAKPVPDKHVSDDDNDLSQSSRPADPFRSTADSSTLFSRPALRTLDLPHPGSKSSPGDEPDGESEGEEGGRLSRSPRRRQSRGLLNRLSHTELRMAELDISDDEKSSSDNSLRRHPPPQRGKKSKAQRSKLVDKSERSDSG